MNCENAGLRNCEILFAGQALVVGQNSLTSTVANFAIAHFRNLAILPGQARVVGEYSLTSTVANFAIPHFRNLAIPFWLSGSSCRTVCSSSTSGKFRNRAISHFRNLLLEEGTGVEPASD